MNHSVRAFHEKRCAGTEQINSKGFMDLKGILVYPFQLYIYMSTYYYKVLFVVNWTLSYQVGGTIFEYS